MTPESEGCRERKSDVAPVKRKQLECISAADLRVEFGHVAIQSRLGPRSFFPFLRLSSQWNLNHPTSSYSGLHSKEMSPLSSLALDAETEVPPLLDPLNLPPELNAEAYGSVAVALRVLVNQ